MTYFLSTYLKVQNVSFNEIVVFWPILSLICIHTLHRQKMMYKNFLWIWEGVCSSTTWIKRQCKPLGCVHSWDLEIKKHMMLEQNYWNTWFTMWLYVNWLVCLSFSFFKMGMMNSFDWILRCLNFCSMQGGTAWDRETCSCCDCLLLI